MTNPTVADPEVITEAELDEIEQFVGMYPISTFYQVRLIKALRAKRARSKAKDAVVEAVRGDRVDLSAYRSDLHVYGDLGVLCTALSVWSNQQPEMGDYRKALKIASLYLESIWEALAALDSKAGGEG